MKVLHPPKKIIWVWKGSVMEVRFVADCMLGRLSKWLRVLGYDTHYQRYYRTADIEHLIREDRRLLSRHKKTAHSYPHALLIKANHVGDQIAELKEIIHLTPDRSKWFSRCLVCNAVLAEAQEEIAQENIPDHVFYENMPGVRSCPSCGRHYWPGTHRTRMVKQLEVWGF